MILLSILSALPGFYDSGMIFKTKQYQLVIFL